MNPRSTLIAAVGVLAVFVAGSIWFTQRKDSKAEGATVSDGARTEESTVIEGTSSSRGEALDGEPTLTTEEVGSGRVALPSGISGRVQLEDPGRHETATVLACTAQLAKEPSVGSRVASDWQSLVGGLASAPLDSEGRFSIEVDEEVASLPRKLVYVVEPNHRLAWTEQTEEGTALELAAASATPVAVKVLAAGEGEPESDPIVFALYSFHPAKAVNQRVEGVTLPFAYTSQSAGAFSVARGGDEVTLWAVAGERRSSEWRGLLDEVDEITLHLGPTFAARGSLEGIHAVEPRPSKLRVSAFRISEGARQRLGTCSATADGSWSLSDLATDGLSDVVFRLEGEGLSTQEEIIPAPRPGSEVKVSFDLVTAQRLIVVLTDFDEDPVPGADLQLSWVEAQDTVFSSSFRTDEDGLGELVEAPAGEVFIHVEKEGVSGGRFGPHVLDEDNDNRVTVRVGRAGRIAGRCVQGGKPVKTFTIRYWKDSPWNVLELQVAGQEDGEFVITDAPLGTVQLLASSPSCPAAPVQVVENTPDAESWIKIELPVPSTAMGRVIDFNTGAPVSDAAVQVLSTASDEHTWAWSAPIEANALGEFRGVPVVAPLTMLEVSAPGYAKIEIRAEAKAGEVYDCETIALPKSQELVVRLIGTGDEDFEQYSASVSTGEAQERIQFDRSGFARFLRVSPGYATITIAQPNSSVFYIGESLEEGGVWRVEVPLDTGRRVNVEVREQDGAQVEEPLWVGISYLTPGGTTSHYYEAVDEEGRVEFTCASEGDVILDVLNGAFELIAMKHLALDPSGVTDVSVRLDRGEHRLRLLDIEANTMASTALVVSLPERPVPWGQTFVTDQDGLVTLHGFGSSVIHLSVDVADGQANAIPVDLSLAGEEPMDVVIDASGRMDLTILDGDEPLSGVWAQLRQRAEGPAFVSALSDEAGQCDMGALTPGDYWVSVTQPGYWPAEAKVEAQLNRPAFVLQVRRLGSLIVRAQGVGGAELDLVSDEFGESVSDWLSSERVTTSTSSMLLDSGGELTISGIPHGSYSWRLTGPSGSTSEGRIDVAPRGMTALNADM